LIQEAEELCDRVAIIVKGKIRMIDTPENLRNQVRETQVLEIKPQSLPDFLPKELELLPGVERATFIEDKIHLFGRSVHQAICQIIDHLNQKRVQILSIKTWTPTLEDAFVKLTGLDAEVMRVDKPQKMGGVG
jgi:ABC-2 type transport system ATP-binding protein